MYVRITEFSHKELVIISCDVQRRHVNNKYFIIAEWDFNKITDIHGS